MINEDRVYPENLPFLERLQLSCDLKSRIKSLWLTGYLVITWEWDGYWETFLDTVGWEWYKGGSYE